MSSSDTSITVHYWYRLLDTLTPRRVVTSIVVVLTIVAGVVYYRPLGERVLTGTAYIAVSVHRTPTLVVPPLPGVTRLVTSNGELLATFAAQAQVPSTLSQISPNLVNALLSSEDRTFFTNDGIDSRGIVRAAIDDLLHHAAQGGSTITQRDSAFSGHFG